MYVILTSLLLYLHCLVIVFCEEGDSCQLSTGVKGTCIKLQRCSYAINLLKNGTYPQICGFDHLDSLVCCKETAQNLIQKPGEISLKKCKEYYPYAIHAIFLPGGELSLAREFPHMAAIGYGDENKIDWSCGGSLISEDFILTAAHCLASRDSPAQWVRLGELDFATDTDDAKPQDYKVIRRIPHPNYRPPAKYHDIGLIQLDRPINRTGFVDISCLDTIKDHTEKQMIATGWGRTEFAGESSTHLLKTNLDLVPFGSCYNHYAQLRIDLPNGILDDLHICAGGKTRQDTCQGDSGGPLQSRNPEPGSARFVYNIAGVTSFGKPCGISKSPGIYTRVYNYLSWIENIVWPS